MNTLALVRSVWFSALACLAGLVLQTRVVAQLPSPAQPILVVQDSGSADPYQRFVPELLTTEGLNGFQSAQLADLTATFLAQYNVVILPHLALNAAQASLLRDYVNAGGTLIGLRPDAQLATVFGVSALGSTLPEAWLRIDTGSPEGAGLVNQVLRFHGTADLYALNGARELGNLYQNPMTATSSPAAAVNGYGQGRAILFAFDLTQSVVLLRQGNPAWAGYPNNHDGFLTMRASQMFTDVGTHASWNDAGDQALNDVPQADEQLRLLSNALVLAAAARQPLPRFWYFPNDARALLLLTGDHHGDAESNSVAEIGTVEAAGGQFTDFLWYPYGSISGSTVTTWLAQGNAIGIHFDDTAEGDGNADGSHATWAGMQGVLDRAIASFAATYPDAPPPVTTRDHFLIWVSNNASGQPDPTAQAKLFANAGIQFDTSFSSFPNRWGYMNGSGLPMKFLDTAAGAVIPVYEQATQYEDDVQLSGTGYSTNWDIATAQVHYEKSLGDSLAKYNTVVTMLFHPDAWALYHNHAQVVLNYAQAHGIPMPSAARWLAFWQGRAATAFANLSFSTNTLSFSAIGAPAGLTLLVPASSGAGAISALAVDGASQTFTVESYQGINYASVVLGAGNHTVAATYGGAATARIFGLVAPLAAAGGARVRIQGGGVDQGLQPDAGGSYATGALPLGTYTLTPSASGYTFTPASQTVTLAGTDVGDVNFTGSANAGTAEMLFTTQTPTLTNLSDGASTNYELGTAFTSGVAGNLTAIRFWKTGAETGTHVGHVWDASGNVLATVTFANETASGWQQQALDTPLAIAANTPYVVSVNTGGSYYVATNQGLATQVTSADLQSVVGNNGVYGAAGTFPTNSYQSTNYFRDVVFTPGPPPPATGETLFTTQIPTLPNQSDGPTSNYELGTAFTSGVSGKIAAIRFWKAPSETGTHVGHLWNASGQVLASVTFANETASGWQQQNLATPIAIDANATYVVSVNTANTYYAATGGGLAAQITNADLRSVVGNNGLFGASGAFPTQTYQGNNYFRDVVFNADPPPPVTGETLFTTQMPALVDESDGASVNYELGTGFTSAVAGNITALRFWKTAKESGTHVGRVWNTAGQQLAAVTFAAETASGWQQQSLDAPLAIAANTPYVVTVNTGNSYYVATVQGLQSAVTNSDLQTVVGNNGLFGPVGQLPNQSYQNSNYFRDVVFTATGAPPVSPPSPSDETLFTTQTPALTNLSDGASTNYELGAAFRSSAAGHVLAIRFWKAGNETGLHTGKIWSVGGQLLASVTFANETASGWQEQSFATPFALAPNTTYVVTVNTGNTYYVATNQGLATPATSAHLSSVVGGNGVYGPVGQAPTQSYQNSNYFRDVVFTTE